MLRLTRQTDYGILLLTHMAAGDATSPFTARALAADSSLPLPMVSKVLKLLARAQLLVSHRGVKGGYSLARSADAITVGELIAVLEGPIAMTECSDEGAGACEHETSCLVRSNWQRINRVVRVALDKLTLADMASPQCDDASLVPLKQLGDAGAPARATPVLETA